MPRDPFEMVRGPQEMGDELDLHGSYDVTDPFGGKVAAFDVLPARRVHLQLYMPPLFMPKGALLKWAQDNSAEVRIDAHGSGYIYKDARLIGTSIHDLEPPDFRYHQPEVVGWPSEYLMVLFLHDQQLTFAQLYAWVRQHRYRWHKVGDLRFNGA